jgi:hypothetical protein
LGLVVQMIFIPPEVSAATSDMDRQTAANTPSPSPTVQRLLSETWDLVDCPMFCEAYTESVDRCFRIVYEELQRNVFSTDGSGVSPQDRPRSAAASASSPHTHLRTPPLASLLPQIKAIGMNLLQPSSPHGPSSDPSSPYGSDFASPRDGSSSSSTSSNRSTSSSVVSANIKEISSGPALDSLCVSILETVNDWQPQQSHIA